MEEIKNDILDWQEQLKQERTELLEKTLKLKILMEDPDIKLSKREWDMLQRQFSFMRDYLQALTDRCVYYGLLEAANLYLEYPSFKGPGC